MVLVPPEPVRGAVVVIMMDEGGVEDVEASEEVLPPESFLLQIQGHLVEAF